MVKAYGGYYKDIFLRSSYEYAYALYLDEIGIKWGYELQNFRLSKKVYKPDFFLYDTDWNLLKIAEVKSESASERKKASEYKKQMKDIHNIDVKIVTLETLQQLYERFFQQSVQSMEKESTGDLASFWIGEKNRTSGKSIRRKPC
ncbi:hypothetical protein SOP93_17405 [Peribacillus frigoritolerans]|uniref:hypothetical protein n=1 Tax=Peribacillus frigoritolerans TaxID=450367 RepID=UPI002B252ABC|nr:hypothetical protein [Peribacillus frigoritolerans]MEB2492939.1 hypothetical protein [Peribacillus frigoritolerans]